MRLWDTIKKPFKWWREFLQRHKSFRAIWWLIAFSMLILGPVFLAWSTKVGGLWKDAIIAIFSIFLLIANPIGLLNELTSGNAYAFLAILFIAIFLWRLKIAYSART